MAITISDFMNEQYDNAMSIVGSNEIIISDLNEAEKALLNIILQFSESAKGVLY